MSVKVWEIEVEHPFIVVSNDAPEITSPYRYSHTAIEHAQNMTEATRHWSRGWHVVDARDGRRIWPAAPEQLELTPAEPALF